MPALLVLVLAQIACLVALAATSWAAGWAAWGRRSEDRLAHPMTSCLGLALLGELGMLLAALHLFRPVPLVLTTVVVHVAAAPGWRRLATAGMAALRRSPRRMASTVSAVAIGVAGSLCIALFPPSGFDETTYHLPLARAVLATGALPWVPELRYPAFPPLAETLQAAMLAAGGERATHLVALLALLLTAALVSAWGREALAPGAGWLAAALLVGSPLAVYLGGTGYVDGLLGLFATACFYSLWRTRREDSPSWPYLAGGFAGAAAGVKYLGLFGVAVGLVALASRRSRLGDIARFTFGVVSTASIPFGYLVARTGNPLFPFLSGIFGKSGWEVTEESIGVGPRLLQALLLPWNAVLRRELAGAQPPLTPALLLGIPLLLWVVIARPSAAPAGLRAGTAIVLAYLPLLALTPSVSHYLLPILPLWCLLAASSLIVFWRQRNGRGLSSSALLVLAVTLALPGPLYGAFWLARRGSVPVTPAQRERYLAAVHPRYDTLAWLDRRAGGRYVVYALHSEHLHAFARGRFLGDWTGPWRFGRVEPLLGDPPRLHLELRGMGAGYLLLPRGAAPALRQPSAAAHFAMLRADTDGEVWRVLPDSAAWKRKG